MEPPQPLSSQIVDGDTAPSPSTPTPATSSSPSSSSPSASAASASSPSSSRRYGLREVPSWEARREEEDPLPDDQQEALLARRQAGDAPILAQYLRAIKKKTPTAASEEQSTTPSKPPPEVGSKRQNEEGKGKGPSKKQRRKERLQQTARKLCYSLSRGLPCPYGDKCRFTHDAEAYLASKPPDIGPRCPIFEETGKCPFGLSCRFGGAHTRDNRNVVNEELASHPKPEVVNILDKGVQVKLRKRKYDFKKSQPFISEWNKLRNEREQVCNTKDGKGTKESNGSKPSDPSSSDAQPTTSEEADRSASATSDEHNTVAAVAPDEDPRLTYVETPLKPCEKKRLDVKGKLYLAPLTTLGNLPYRRVCKRFGADITCGEMALGENLLQGQASEWALLKRHPCEDLFGVQICGSQPEHLTKCAQLLEETIGSGIDFVDINAGCPIDVITKRGAGSALLDRPRRVEGILKGCGNMLTCPVTIKVRIGKDEKAPTTHKLLPWLDRWGAASVTIHGRSRLQRYTKEADWQYIKRCVKVVEEFDTQDPALRMPLIGNGDIYNWEQAEAAFDTGVSTVMIARGALIKPWIFTEIKERRHWDISSRERFDMLQDFANFGLIHWGSDDQGVATTREFLLQWQSFLHRYIPVGLLEALPSKLAQRPPGFFGRNDLETLLASPKVSDWIKLSEMLLGPVPDNFVFVPKHKSNAYAAEEPVQG